MAHRKRRKPSKADIKAAADRAERPPEEEPAAEPVAIDPEIIKYIPEDDVIDPDEMSFEGVEPEGTKRGRRTEYDPAILTDVQEWAASGLTDFEIAENLGVSDRTLYRWRAKHREFRQALRIGKLEPDRRVEASVYHSAIGYKQRAVKIMQYEGQPVIIPYIEKKPPDIGAAKMWLTNRQRKRWKDKTASEISGPDGGPIRTEDVGDTELARRLAFVLNKATQKIKGQRT